MERIIKVHIKKLPGGHYLATSEEIQGLVAQGRTIAETLEIARDVAKKLMEAQTTGRSRVRKNYFSKGFDYPLVVGL